MNARKTGIVADRFNVSWPPNWTVKELKAACEEDAELPAELFTKFPSKFCQISSKFCIPCTLKKKRPTNIKNCSFNFSQNFRTKLFY